MSNGGRWVEVAQPDGTARRDWRPDEQPASPDGGPGDWHVVTGGGGPDRWEWVPGSAPGGPLTPPPPPAPMFAGGAQPGGFLQQSDVLTAEREAAKVRRAKPFPRKPALIAGGVAAVVIIGAIAAMGLSGGGSSGPSTIDSQSVAAGNASAQTQLKSGLTAAFSAFGIGVDPAGARRGGMQVQFTNSSSEEKSFEARLQALSAQGGALVAETSVEVIGLAPGQSVTRDVFLDVPDDKLDAMTGANVQVVSYDYLAPLPE